MGRYVVGVDVGGTKVAYGLFGPDGELKGRLEHLSDREADGPAFSDQIIAHVHRLLDEAGVSIDEVDGVGVCICSYIIFDTGYIYLTSALEKIQNFYMRDYLQEKLGVRVVLDNDANVAALAEHRKGAGRGTKHMVYMAVSTGLGSGIIINGELFRGSYGFAGENGHMLITPDEGVRCGCRNRGCFMSYGSGRYIPSHAKMRMLQGKESILSSYNQETLSAKDIYEACTAGDELALEMLDQMAHYIGVCTYNIYQLLNINVFVFGGGLTAFGDMLFDRVRKVFDSYNHIDLPVEFRFAQLKKDFGIIGAAELVR